MARLTTKQRKALPDSDFAGPGRSYPVENPPHARNALSRAAQFGSPNVKANVKAMVAKRFPGIQVGGQPTGQPTAVKPKAKKKVRRAA